MKIDPNEMRVAAAKAEKLLKALANGQRLMILCQLVEGEKSVKEIASKIELGQSALSQHLARLRQDDLVTTRRESQSIFYSLKDPAAEAVLQRVYEVYCAPPPPDARKRRSNGN